MTPAGVQGINSGSECSKTLALLEIVKQSTSLIGLIMLVSCLLCSYLKERRGNSIRIPDTYGA